MEEDGDTTGASTISSVVSSTISSAVSSAAATPVVSPAQSPGPVVSQPQPALQVHGAPSVTSQTRVAQVQAATVSQNGTWASGREKRSNRWANTAATYGKVEKKELRKRKPTSCE